MPTAKSGADPKKTDPPPDLLPVVKSLDDWKQPDELKKMMDDLLASARLREDVHSVTQDAAQNGHRKPR